MTWSDPHALRGRVIDSNLFKPGSTWELWATHEDGGSRVEIRAVRHLRGRGWLLAPFIPDPTGFRSGNSPRALAPFSPTASKRRSLTPINRSRALTPIFRPVRHRHFVLASELPVMGGVV